MKTAQLIISSILLVLLVIEISFSGCVNNDNHNQYNKVMLTREGISFSFEYPLTYSESGNSFQDAHTQIIVCRNLAGSSTSDMERYISVIPLPLFNLETSVSVLADISIEVSRGTTQDYVLLERRSTKVSGLEAEIIVWTGFIPNGLMDSNIKCWKAILKYKEYEWYLCLYSNVDSTDGAEVEFQHYIDTFQFLD